MGGGAVDGLEVKGDEGEDGEPEEEDVRGLPDSQGVAPLRQEQQEGGLQVTGLVGEQPHHRLGTPHLGDQVQHAVERMGRVRGGR